MTATKAEFAAMSWHQRQTLNARLRAETAQLQAEVERLNSPAIRRQFDAQMVRAMATLILAALPPDPDGARHRLELDRELRTRKAKP